jgi:hypothetical protein
MLSLRYSDELRTVLLSKFNIWVEAAYRFLQQPRLPVMQTADINSFVLSVSMIKKKVSPGKDNADFVCFVAPYGIY